jgi:hypothetical protein
VRTALIVVGVLAAIAIVGGLFAFNNTSSSSSSTSSASSRAAWAPPATSFIPTTTNPPLPLPTPADFTINVIITKQDCFGSGGCNVEYEINPDFTGPIAQLNNRSLRVIYQVDGGENPKTGSFTVDNGTAHYQKSGSISTDTDVVNITATATQVIPEQ